MRTKGSKQQAQIRRALIFGGSDGADCFEDDDGPASGSSSPTIIGASLDEAGKKDLEPEGGEDGTAKSNVYDGSGGVGCVYSGLYSSSRGFCCSSS